MDRLHSIWSNMKQRCDNANRSDYKYYGGKGITYDEKWNESKEFCDWAIRNGYNENLTLERKDCTGNYEPNNCKWISFQEQRLNTSQTRKITLNGKTQCLKKWCEELNLDYCTIFARIKRGMNEIEALQKPIKRSISQ